MLVLKGIVFPLKYFLLTYLSLNFCSYETYLLLVLTILNCLWGITSSWRERGLPAPKIPQHFGRSRSAAGGIQETTCTSRETLWFVDKWALFKWGLMARDMAEIDSCLYLRWFLSLWTWLVFKFRMSFKNVWKLNGLDLFTIKPLFKREVKKAF